MVGEMRVNDIEKVLPCIADPWKLRIIAHLDEKPDLPLIAKYLDGKYSENLGMVVIKIGIKEMNFFQNGQITVRMVDSEQEASDLVNRILAMAYHKAMIGGDI
jgi:ArsR family metal-binding transcriptional regulator